MKAYEKRDIAEQMLTAATNFFFALEEVSEDATIKALGAKFNDKVNSVASVVDELVGNLKAILENKFEDDEEGGDD